MKEYDVVIAGGGHNGLACGAVLAKEGLKVLVAERGKWLGGGVVTREVTLPGLSMIYTVLPMFGFMQMPISSNFYRN